MQRVNKRYEAAPGAITERFAQRGMAGSGKLAQNLMGIDLARMGDMASLENDFASLILGRQDANTALGERLLGVPHGTSGTGKQQTTLPGNVAGGAVSGGLETLMALIGLNKRLGGSGAFDKLSGGGGGGGYSGW